MDERHYQRILLDKIRNQLDETQSLTDHVTEILELSKDSVYRRLRGETSLSFDEAIKLAQNFGLSLSEVAGYSDHSAVFARQAPIRTIQEYRDYMQRSLHTLEQLKKQRDHKMLYSAKDVPIFYHFAFPKLAAFKIYVWLKSVYDIHTIDGKYYSLKDVPQDLIDLAGEQWSVFSQLNTVEIWNDTTILSLLKQVAYYYEAGMFTTREEALEICEQCREMVKVIYKQALTGQKVHAHNPEKNSGAYCKMYYHEILIMDNHILAETGNDTLLYFIPYAGVNYMTTSDPGLTENVKEYLEGQIRKSALMSDISEKERNRFFIRIKGKIDQLMDKINATDPFI